jgi:hypothetical protein
MTQPGHHPDPSRRDPVPVAAPGPHISTVPGSAPAWLRPAILVFLATVAASALLGLLAGLIWSAVAPRALLVVQGRGVAFVANPETTAFIVADAWFCLLTALGGLMCGAAGYLLAIRRHGAVALAGLLAGGVAASWLAMWVGQQQGLALFRSRLAASPAGTRLREPLMLGGHGALAFWPLLVGLVAGSIELISQSVENRRSVAARLSQVVPAGVADADPGVGRAGGIDLPG